MGYRNGGVGVSKILTAKNAKVFRKERKGLNLSYFFFAHFA